MRKLAKTESVFLAVVRTTNEKSRNESIVIVNEDKTKTPYPVEVQAIFVVLCPLHVLCSIEFSASRAYTRALSDLETQLPNEGFTITDYNKGKGADSPVAYIYNQI